MTPDPLGDDIRTIKMRMLDLVESTHSRHRHFTSRFACEGLDAVRGMPSMDFGAGELVRISEPGDAWATPAQARERALRILRTCEAIREREVIHRHSTMRWSSQ